MNISSKYITGAWLVLLALTLIAVYISTLSLSYGAMISIVVFTTVVKGQQIVDIFMGMKKAPAKWRILLLGYVVLVPLLTGSVIALF